MPSRDARIDTLRGLALVVMTIDHLQGRIREVTWQFPGFVSAAEAFVLLSGLVAGMVFTRRQRVAGDREVFRKSWWRAVELYVYHILPFLGLKLLGLMAEGYRGAWEAWIPLFRDAPMFETPLRSVILGLLLVYQPTHLDILPMYSLFLVLLPFALAAIVRGGAAWIGLASFGVWLVARGGRTDVATTEFLAGLGLPPPFFDVVAWQLLFFGGIILGWMRATGRLDLGVSWVRGLTWVAAALAAALFLLRWELVPNGWMFELLDLRQATDIPSLGWLRLLNFAAVALVVTGFARWRPRWTENRWLALLGRHSLQVYTVHILCVFLLAPWFMSIHSAPLALEAGATAAVLGLLTLVAIGHERWIARAARIRAEAGIRLRAEAERRRVRAYARSTG